MTNRPEITSPRHIPVLMYHRVVAETTSGIDPWTVSAGVFRLHLKTLEQVGCTPITFEDLYLCFEGKLRLPRKPVILTFDDGYADIHNVAFPILRDFGSRAVVFVVPNAERRNVWDIGSSNSGAELLSDRQIVELHEAGCEIGSHTMTHRDLTRLALSEAWEEIVRSRQILEILTNHIVRSFAYPFGAMNREIKLLVSKAGYSFGCSVFSGPRTLHQDHYEIRRLAVTEDIGRAGIGIRLLPWYQFQRWAIWRGKYGTWTSYIGAPFQKR